MCWFCLHVYYSASVAGAGDEKKISRCVLTLTACPPGGGKWGCQTDTREKPLSMVKRIISSHSRCHAGCRCSRCREPPPSAASSVLRWPRCTSPASALQSTRREGTGASVTIVCALAIDIDHADNAKCKASLACSRVVQRPGRRGCHIAGVGDVPRPPPPGMNKCPSFFILYHQVGIFYIRG